MIWLYKIGCVVSIMLTLMFMWAFLQVVMADDRCKKCRAMAVPLTCFAMLFQVSMLAEKILT